MERIPTIGRFTPGTLFRSFLAIGQGTVWVLALAESYCPLCLGLDITDILCSSSALARTQLGALWHDGSTKEAQRHLGATDQLSVVNSNAGASTVMSSFLHFTKCSMRREPRSILRELVRLAEPIIMLPMFFPEDPIAANVNDHLFF